MLPISHEPCPWAMSRTVIFRRKSMSDVGPLNSEINLIEGS